MSIKKKVAIKDLKTNLFVRQVLNQDHVLYLAELIENGVKLPPIRITPDYGVIDGRHRIEAYELNNITEIEAEIVSIKDETDLISQAYRANVGGPLPPSPKDTEHVVMLLIERNESKKRIAELLGLPVGMTRKYVESIQSKIARQKMAKAIEAVTEGGLTAAKAAEQYDVKLEKLKETLSGQKSKRKWGIAEVQRNLTTLYRSVGQKNASLMRSLREKYVDGDITPKQVQGIFTHLSNLQKKSSRAIAMWEKRFEAMNTDKT